MITEDRHGTWDLVTPSSVLSTDGKCLAAQTLDDPFWLTDQETSNSHFVRTQSGCWNINREKMWRGKKQTQYMSLIDCIDLVDFVSTLK